MNLNTPPGQMTEMEKKYLFYVASKERPSYVLESGTWKGGGSTLDIVSALYENNFGVLHTFEEWTEYYNIANDFYKNSKYTSNITLHNQSFLEGIKQLGDELLSQTTMVFLDGGDETPQGGPKLPIERYHQDYNLSENVQSFIYLEDKLPIGANILLHDWSISVGRGFFIRLYLEATSNNRFELVNLLPVSTGLAHLIKVK